MVFSSSILSPRFNSTMKENVAFKANVLRNVNGRHPRSRNDNLPSPVVLTLETTRRPTPQHPSTSSEPAYTPRQPTRTPRRAEETDMEISHDTSPPVQRTVHLPRHLKRPAFREISPSSIEAIDADLKDVALQYIQEQLQAVGEQMFTVASTTTAHPPRDRLPRELEVVINDLSADPPTHLFAIYSKPSSRVSIHPAHALILAIHCANLPPLSPALALAYPPSPPPAFTGKKMTLPVIPLCIPHPATFPVLLHYLYTKRRDRLLASLLPLPPRATTSDLGALSETLAATFTVPVLLGHAQRVHGLWANVAGLGVFDDKLWCGIEMVWEVLAEALAIRTGSSWQTMTVAELA